MPDIIAGYVIGSVETLDANHPTAPNGGMITPENGVIHPFVVLADYMTAHNPQPGGTYVRYVDNTEGYMTP